MLKRALQLFGCVSLLVIAVTTAPTNEPGVQDIDARAQPTLLRSPAATLPPPEQPVQYARGGLPGPHSAPQQQESVTAIRSVSNLANSCRNPAFVGNLMELMEVIQPAKFSSSEDQASHLDTDTAAAGGALSHGDSSINESCAELVSQADPEAGTSVTALEAEGSETAPGENEQEERYDFAATSHGAKVLAANREAKKAAALLDADSDSFMRNDCKADKWLIVELAQVAKLDTLVLSQFEMYSSRVKDFQVFGRSSHPRNDGMEYSKGLSSPAWHSLGSFTATNVKGPQAFRVLDSPWVRFLLLRFLTQYGNEPVCALNDVRAYGRSAAEDLEDRLAWEPDEAVDGGATVSGDEAAASAVERIPGSSGHPGSTAAISPPSSEPVGHPVHQAGAHKRTASLGDGDADVAGMVRGKGPAMHGAAQVSAGQKDPPNAVLSQGTTAADSADGRPASASRPVSGMSPQEDNLASSHQPAPSLAWPRAAAAVAEPGIIQSRAGPPLALAVSGVAAEPSAAQSGSGSGIGEGTADGGASTAAAAEEVRPPPAAGPGKARQGGGVYDMLVQEIQSLKIAHKQAARAAAEAQKQLAGRIEAQAAQVEQLHKEVDAVTARLSSVITAAVPVRAGPYSPAGRANATCPAVGVLDPAATCRARASDLEQHTHGKAVAAQVRGLHRHALQAEQREMAMLGVTAVLGGLVALSAMRESGSGRALWALQLLTALLAMANGVVGLALHLSSRTEQQIIDLRWL